MSGDDSDISRRKRDHVRVCLDDERSQFDRTATGFDRLRFEHHALPEISLDEVDLTTTFVGKKLAAPILVSSMTGGPALGKGINRNIALACQRLGLGMGVGSQRIAIEDDATKDSFVVRDIAPDIPLFANLGAVQLNYGYGAAQAERAVEMIDADGLFLHLNPLQEAVQEGGDTNFSNLLEKIAALVAACPFPILVKEVGAGISPTTLDALIGVGVHAVDVSGAGGTSWARVEGERAASAQHRTLGETFANWGIPTTVAIERGRRRVPDARIIASGGLRTGLDAAKAIALGADMVSFAQPVLEAATRSAEAVEAVLERLIAELRVALFCVGARDLGALRTSAALEPF